MSKEKVRGKGIKKSFAVSEKKCCFKNESRRYQKKQINSARDIKSFWTLQKLNEKQWNIQ